MTGKEAQTKMVLNHLKKYGSLTAMEAFKTYGIMRLAARIADLRESGVSIWSERVSVLDEDNREVGHYARYHMA